MQEKTLLIAVTFLFIIVMALVCAMLHIIRYRMARIYNWNGRCYSYLGYVPIRRENGDFALYIGGHMVDLSRTTRYRICPGRRFCKKNRYRNLFVYADGNREHVVIDREEMKTEIPF
ncbi:MAG: hypothetical protein NC314_00520 [Roseburia sp.]|nr:hypothetical protein [Roseburia sp.]MCM1241296.1 hypothetical protein [Roseburia sp.]